MAEYIERAAAIAWFMPYAHTGESIEADVVISDIKGMKAADVAPVVHGRWAIDEFGCFCTACREYTADIETGEDCQLVPMRSHYCPNCGARMDGDG